MPQHPTKAGAARKQLNQLIKTAAAVLALRIAVALAFWNASAHASELPVPAVNAEAQEKTTQLLQTIIQDYWNGSETRSAAENAGNSTNIELTFRKASELMPERLDLRFWLASSLMAQALQTNGQPLRAKVQAAFGVYKDIQALDTNGFEAPLLYAAYARAIGQTNEAETVISRLMSVHPQRASDYLAKFEFVERVLQLTPNEKARRSMPGNEYHAIVVLGAGLETNGTMKSKLRSRLEQCRKLARMYPRAPIVLTGGNQKGGVTEAYVMSIWCMHKGISRKRLFLEDKAKDTVENALFASAILKRLGVTHVTLVTSSNHMRRGLADLEEACTQRGLSLQFDNLASRTKADKDLDKEQERVGVYRDVMRTSGIWAYPGLLR